MKKINVAEKDVYDYVEEFDEDYEKQLDEEYLDNKKKGLNRLDTSKKLFSK